MPTCRVVVNSIFRPKMSPLLQCTNTFPIPSLCNTCPSFSNTFLKHFQYVFLLPMCLDNQNVKHLLWQAFCNFHLLLQTFCFSLPSEILSAIFFLPFSLSLISLSPIAISPFSVPSFHFFILPVFSAFFYI